MAWDSVVSDSSIQAAVAALKAANISATVVNSGVEAREAVLKMLPEKAEVMTMTSVTLETIGLEQELNESGKFVSVKKKLSEMNRETDHKQMQQLGAAPEWAVGSVHAVTEDGKVLVASNTGSQLPGYTYGADHVIWVVGAQKIVKNLDEAMKRIYEYVLPLESERARKAYGTEGSNVSKLLIFSKEVNPTRIQMVIVKEKLGF